MGIGVRVGHRGEEEGFVEFDAISRHIRTEQTFPLYWQSSCTRCILHWKTASLRNFFIPLDILFYIFFYAVVCFPYPSCCLVGIGIAPRCGSSVNAPAFAAVAAMSTAERKAVAVIFEKIWQCFHVSNHQQ